MISNGHRVEKLKLKTSSADAAYHATRLLEDAFRLVCNDAESRLALPSKGALVYVRKFSLGRIQGSTPANLIAEKIQYQLLHGYLQIVNVDSEDNHLADIVWFSDEIVASQRLIETLLNQQQRRSWYWPLVKKQLLGNESVSIAAILRYVNWQFGMAGQQSLLKQLVRGECLIGFLEALTTNDVAVLSQKNVAVVDKVQADLTDASESMTGHLLVQYRERQAEMNNKNGLPYTLYIATVFRELFEPLFQSEVINNHDHVVGLLWKLIEWGAFDARTKWIINLLLVKQNVAAENQQKLASLVEFVELQHRHERPIGKTEFSQLLSQAVAFSAAMFPHNHSKIADKNDLISRFDSAELTPHDTGQNVPLSEKQSDKVDPNSTAESVAQSQVSQVKLLPGEYSEFAGLFLTLNLLDHLTLPNQTVKVDGEEYCLPHLLLHWLAEKVRGGSSFLADLGIPELETADLFQKSLQEFCINPVWHSWLLVNKTKAPKDSQIVRCDEQLFLLETKQQKILSVHKVEENSDVHVSILNTQQSLPTLSQGLYSILRILSRFLLRNTGLGLKSLVNKSGNIVTTNTHIDIYFSTKDLTIETRRLGLDVSPGWLPWLGRVINVHYHVDELKEHRIQAAGN